MSRESIVLVLGIVVFFTPWLGIPDDWKLYILAAAGVVLIIDGYLLRRAAYLRRIDIGNGERGTDSFVESGTPAAEDAAESAAELPADELQGA